jgi:hypothetical protein
MVRRMAESSMAAKGVFGNKPSCVDDLESVCLYSNPAINAF